MSRKQFVKFWRKFRAKKPPYVHPLDLDWFEKHDPTSLQTSKLTFSRYIRSKSFGGNENDFHLALMPVPYEGDLARADIFILLINPGFSHIDYFAEFSHPTILRFRRRAIAQKLDNVTYPFYPLDPRLCWTGGFRWWEGKLKNIAKTIAAKKGISYQNALRLLARRVAAIELIPYRSRRAPGNRKMAELPSRRMALKYVRGELASRASKGEALIIVTRRARDWAVRRGKNVIVFTGVDARGAHLSPKTRAGKRILAYLGYN
jgi:hypothetical protein